jgi:hypothetical protein
MRDEGLKVRAGRCEVGGQCARSAVRAGSMSLLRELEVREAFSLTSCKVHLIIREDARGHISLPLVNSAPRTHPLSASKVRCGKGT